MRQNAEQLALAQWIRAQWPTVDRREIWEWAAEKVDFGNSQSFKGHYDVENVPWTREMLRAFRNLYVREITFIAPPQESGKTVGAEICLSWRIVNEPGKIAFNTVTNTGALKWQETRWSQMMRSAPAVRRMLDDNPDKTKRGRIIFRNGTFLLIQGAENPANRQSDSVEIQVNDEGHLWEKPWMKEMHSRTRAYGETRKILNISIGANKGTELHERWLAGNQAEWSHHCPKCGKPFQYVFDNKSPVCNIRFDMTKAVQHADGRLDLREFARSVAVNCPREGCDWKTGYDAELLARLNAGGVYVPMNPDAAPEIVSLHVNAFAIGRRPWAEILEPWVRLHIRGGVFASEVLRNFIVQDLAEFWEERPMVVSREIKLGSYVRGEVIKAGSWKDEWIRIMTVDNQRGAHGDVPHRWFVCRAFSKDGRSRLIDCGRIDEWVDVRKKQLELGVPDWTPERPGPWVVVDRRHDPVAVDEVCAKYKWYGLMGTDSDEFLHGPNSPHAGNRVLFSEERYIDVGYGTAEQGRMHAIYYLWSSQKIQDVLAALRDGKAEEFEVPADINEWCPQYAEHINSHRQIMEHDKKGNEKRVWKRIGGWPDHLYDAESMGCVLGLMAGVFKTD